MASKYAFENLFRDPWEWLVSVLGIGFGCACLLNHQMLGLSVQMSPVVSVPFFSLGLLRGAQALKIILFRRRLLLPKLFSMSTGEVPHSKKNVYIGRGFKWQPIHRQRLNLLSLVENERFVQRSRLYRHIQQAAKETPGGWCDKLTRQSYLPFKPMPDIGGKPWLHGVGSDMEKPVYLKQANRNSHECVFGMTRVGKTRYLSIKVNQDIRNHEAVLVIDPKGDLEVMQDIYCAANDAGRLEDLRIVHLGFPDISAKYNPLSAFSNVSEVATRITGAMSASGEGQQFKDFAWQYLNIVSRCLNEMGIPINYKTIGFYIKRPEVLMVSYVDQLFPSIEPDYLSQVEDILDTLNSRVDKNGNPLPPVKRSVAVKRYLDGYIESQSAGGRNKQLMESVIAPLYSAVSLDKTYYDKITASVGPVLDKINQTQAGEVFSWEYALGLPEVKLEDVIKRNQIVYIGLDTLTNRETSEAVGQAIISDLVSLCGRLYNESSKIPYILNLYCDEFSNIVREEFVTLLNKAGGIGIRVTALTQTINDLGAAFSDSQDKAKMLLGNFGTLTMLRVANDDTASNFTECLESIRARTSTPSTMSNDRADGNSGELFTTYNTDAISEDKISVIEVNDLYSLPKGQAFVMTNGGELYKIRIPLPKNDGVAPETFEMIMSEVNLCYAA